MRTVLKTVTPYLVIRINKSIYTFLFQQLLNSSSSFSVGAAVYTETLFKSGGVKGESFLDQQFWLYLYGIFVASTVHLISNPHYGINGFITDIGGEVLVYSVVNRDCSESIFIPIGYSTSTQGFRKISPQCDIKVLILGINRFLSLQSLSSLMSMICWKWNISGKLQCMLAQLKIIVALFGPCPFTSVKYKTRTHVHDHKGF